mmetsp:Transcript_25337/g.66735  ORF Transcript_25337/g.66735 Transcript_25337/m.66735 type:complete len:1331 (+) Transcript_25337:1-3993(+)
MNHGSTELFDYVLFALNQLLWARAKGIVPYIDFGSCVVNGGDHFASGAANLFHDNARGSNSWEYFFEPVSGFNDTDTSRYDVRSGSSSALWQLHRSRPDAIYAHYYARHAEKRSRGYDEPWFRAMRMKANSLIRQFVRVKPHLRFEVERFWQEEVAPPAATAIGGHAVIGIDIRRTNSLRPDKKSDSNAAVVDPSSFAPFIDRLLVQWPKASLLVSTDSPTFLGELQQLYPGRIVTRPTVRSEAHAVLDAGMGTNYQRGADFVIDSLLLSRTDFLLKCSSTVGEFATYWNPALHDNSLDVELALEDISYRYNFFAFGSKAKATDTATSTAQHSVSDLPLVDSVTETRSSLPDVTSVAPRLPAIEASSEKLFIYRPRNGSAKLPEVSLQCYAKNYPTVFAAHCNTSIVSSAEQLVPNTPADVCDWFGLAADWQENGTTNFRTRTCQPRSKLAANPMSCSGVEVVGASLVAHTDVCGQFVDCEVADPSLLERCAESANVTWVQMLRERYGSFRDSHAQFFSAPLLINAAGDYEALPSLEELLREATSFLSPSCTTMAHVVLANQCHSESHYADGSLLAMLAHAPHAACTRVLIIDLCTTHSGQASQQPMLDVRDRMHHVTRLTASWDADVFVTHKTWVAQHDMAPPDVVIFAKAGHARCADGTRHVATPVSPIGKVQPADDEPVMADLRLTESLECYAKRYLDVLEACPERSKLASCNVTAVALSHFRQVGAAAGRTLSCDKEGDLFAMAPRSLMCYVLQNEDIHKEMCAEDIEQCDWEKVRQHYVSTGLAEKRTMRCDKLAAHALRAAALWTAASNCVPTARRPSGHATQVKVLFKALLAESAHLVPLPESLLQTVKSAKLTNVSGTEARQLSDEAEAELASSYARAGPSATEAAESQWIQPPPKDAKRTVALRCLEPDFIMRNRRMLPSATVEASRCAEPTDQDDKEALQAMVARAGEQACLDSPENDGTIQTAPPPTGWLAALHGIIKPLGRALTRSKKLQLASFDAFTDPALCSSRSLDCFFEVPMQRCSAASAKNIRLASEGPSAQEGETPASQLVNTSHTSNTEQAALGSKDAYLLKGSEAIPSALRHRGWFYWIAQLQKLAMAPTIDLRAQIDAALHSTSLRFRLASDAPVVGLHVSRATSCNTNEQSMTAQSCSPLSAYIAQIEQYAKETGVRTIYLATDSKEVIAETANYPQYEFLYLTYTNTTAKVSHDSFVSLLASNSRPWEGVVLEREEIGGTADTHRIASLTTVDMLLLSMCDIFVGKFSSRFFRTAYALHAAKCDCAAPYVSLDAPWCFEDGMASGSNLNFPQRDPISMRPLENKFLC